ncbi:MAG: TerB N-terminal domain-containing protein, partial [bacterium]|nr:TerB N-terminal domain-containing protein [bacterium]
MDIIRKLFRSANKPKTIANIPNHVPQHALGKLSVVGLIPQDVLQLLWFIDGPLKNYVPIENSASFGAGPVVITIRLGRSEPSAISIQLPIATKSVDWDAIPDPSYYPTYESLTPEQKHKYLTWLTNVERDIQIGYVFIFYYGLERHLFFGRVNEAFNMVLKLRRKHLNRSFLHYSESALIASAIFRNRPDLFVRYSEAASSAGILEVSNLYLLAKAALNIPLTTEEIISISKKVGFTTQRYITGEPDLFKIVLGDLLKNEYCQRSLPLSQFPVAEWPRVPEIIVANISFSQEQRTIPIPHLLESDEFRQSITALLQTTH